LQRSVSPLSDRVCSDHIGNMTAIPQPPKVQSKHRRVVPLVVTFMVGVICGALAFSFVTRHNQKVMEDLLVNIDANQVLTNLWLLQVMDGENADVARRELAGRVAAFLHAYGSAEDAIAPKGGALTERFEVRKQRNPFVSETVARIAVVRKEHPEIHQLILERTQANREAIKTAKAEAAARAQFD
jgi:hypothetical protein